MADFEVHLDLDGEVLLVGLARSNRVRGGDRMMARSKSIQVSGFDPPYFVEYAVEDADVLGITASLLADRATWIAAAVAASAALAAFALPFHLNVVVAIAAAMAVGVLIDHFSPPRAALAVAQEDAP